MERKVKCVVWDLDNTIWNGILLEDDELTLNNDAVLAIKEFDKRGILQSISSKNYFEDAKKKLEEFGLWEYFIYPEINWNDKSQSIESIAKNINIGIDTLAFIDDQKYECDEVNFKHPEVLCIGAECIGDVLNDERFIPLFITEDSSKRRNMYQTDIVRNSIEKKFDGTKEEFLASLKMKLTISRAHEEDLQRAEELTVRTHQLNSTGYMYSYNELKAYIESEDYEVLVAQLDDKYGSYGKIGLALVEKKKDTWELKLLLMSCRVMSKGVGNVLMNYIINCAIEEEKILQAQFVSTDKNRVMYITYKFNGFSEVDKRDNVIILQADMSYRRQNPKYIEVVFFNDK